MRTTVITFGAVLLLSVGSRAQVVPLAGTGPVVVMETELGVLEITVDSIHAPVTTRNFLRYIDARLYDGGDFFRTVTPTNQPDDSVKIAVIQCDINSKREDESFPPITLERTSITGLRHRDGTVSMARSEPNSATSSIFICIGDQPELDFGGKRNKDGQGFAAFGRVTGGMEVAIRIHEAHAVGQQLAPPIRIVSAKRKL